MVMILGVPFIESTLVKKALLSFYGVGETHATRILAKFSIFPQARVGSLPMKTQLALTAELSGMVIETEARKAMQTNIARLKDMGSYRGRRHAMGLPVRGQNTRSQINTARKLNKVERRG
ncbi:hypothetical protein K3495_g9413 [Podosphaera aphanis]|nr:hypothetical protein K3495_g9413 [Podosphaera aphanis]